MFPPDFDFRSFVSTFDFIDWVIWTWLAICALVTLIWAVSGIIDMFFWWLDRHERRFLKDLTEGMRDGMKAFPKGPAEPVDFRYFDEPLTNYEKKRGF